MSLDLIKMIFDEFSSFMKASAWTSYVIWFARIAKIIK